MNLLLSSWTVKEQETATLGGVLLCNNNIAHIFLAVEKSYMPRKISWWHGIKFKKREETSLIWVKPCVHGYQILLSHKIKCYLNPMKPHYEIMQVSNTISFVVACVATLETSIVWKHSTEISHSIVRFIIKSPLAMSHSYMHFNFELMWD